MSQATTDQVKSGSRRRLVITVLVIAAGTVLSALLLWNDRGARLMFFDTCAKWQPLNEALHCSTNYLTEQLGDTVGAQ